MKKTDKMEWRDIESAPRDGTRILLLTGDFGVVEGWWEMAVPNFYKTMEGSASYDHASAQGDWVSEWTIGEADEHRRLFCGATPQYWMAKPAAPEDVCI